MSLERGTQYYVPEVLLETVVGPCLYGDANTLGLALLRESASMNLSLHFSL